MALFNHLEIETIGSCNRKCGWCMRNTDPDREAVSSHFSGTKLPTKVIKRLVDEAVGHGFDGTVCLSHYNEPLQDSRIAKLGEYVSGLGLRVSMHSNGDLLTPDLAASLDGAFSVITFACYDRLTAKERKEMILGLFRHTRISFAGDVIPTHFSQVFEVGGLVAKNLRSPCYEPDKRMIVNHAGQMLLCCNDMTGRFGLPTVYEGLTVGEMWYTGRRVFLSRRLKEQDGRGVHQHCLQCPRP